MASPSLQPMSRHFRLAWQAIGVLILITFGLLTWHHYGMEERVELTDGRFPVDAIDDGKGAASKERRDLRGTDHIMRCTFAKGVKEKDCAVHIDLLRGDTGMDMSRLD